MLGLRRVRLPTAIATSRSLMDAIYTPPDLAEFLAAASSLANPLSVADFAAGDGALLRAAAARWPRASLFGSDIDEGAVRSINSLLPECTTALHDFLQKSGESPLSGRSFDLILLNPPFSSRGSTRYSTDVGNVNHSGSKALVFAAHALSFLAPGGEVIAILPASVLVSERDADLLAAMQAWGSVEQIGEVRKAAFKSHAVAVTVLRISKAQRGTAPKEKPFLVSLRPYAVEIARGSLPVHDYVATKIGPRFIHTTDMRDGRLLTSRRRASPKLRCVKGPAVLIPRVGRPSASKIVLLPKCDAVLSDCVVALHTTPPGNERALASLLRENWNSFQSAYGGSCAPYTTVKRVSDALLRIGLVSSVRPEERATERRQTGIAETPVARKRIRFHG